MNSNLQILCLLITSLKLFLTVFESQFDISLKNLHEKILLIWVLDLIHQVFTKDQTLTWFSSSFHQVLTICVKAILRNLLISFLKDLFVKSFTLIPITLCQVQLSTLLRLHLKNWKILIYDQAVLFKLVNVWSLLTENLVLLFQMIRMKN